MTLAEAIGFQDTVQRLLDFTDQLRTLDVDKHEYVALKVLILMNPGLYCGAINILYTRLLYFNLPGGAIYNVMIAIFKFR